MEEAQAQNAAIAALSPGERLIWSGRPGQGFLLRPEDWFLVPFSLFWCGFAFFWEYLVLEHGAPLFMALAGIPFLLIGLYLVFGRFVADAMIRARTVYGLGDRHAVIVSGLLGRSVRSIDLATVQEIEIRQRRNGTGTISFGRVPPGGGWFVGTPWPGTPAVLPPSFEAIPDVRTVYDRMRAIQAAIRDH